MVAWSDIADTYDDEWVSVGAAFREFTQRLWRYTCLDHDNRLEAFQDCSKACEKALKSYHDAVVEEREMR